MLDFRSAVSGLVRPLPVLGSWAHLEDVRLTSTRDVDVAKTRWKDVGVSAKLTVEMAPNGTSYALMCNPSQTFP